MTTFFFRCSIYSIYSTNYIVCDVSLGHKCWAGQVMDFLVLIKINVSELNLLSLFLYYFVIP